MRQNAWHLTAACAFGLFAALVLPASLRAQSDADKIYNAKCALCHAADGSGSSPTGKALKAKDLKSDEVQKGSDADLETVITNGRGKMPAFGKKLKPEEIKMMVSYVRGLAKK
jgi:mono/diheme cytochrome c family protein